jgi:hypothetical protein
MNHLNRSQNLFKAGAGALMIVLMGACAQQRDSATGPSSADLQLTGVDSALIAVHASADATVSDISTLTDSSSGCILNPVDGRFDCPPFVNGRGVTVTRSLAFFDVNGVMMDHRDSTTASMNVEAILAGIVATANGADTVNGTRNLTATGLLGQNTTRTWNGTGASTHGAYWTDSVATRTADVSFSSTFSNIVVQLPRSANPYPISGTITRIVTGTGVVTRNGKTKSITISRTVVITFNGTEFATMVVGSENFSLDLATGVATKN